MFLFRKNNLKIGVLGSGSFGTALAITFSERNQVTLWGHNPSVIDVIKSDRSNPKYLKEITIPEKIEVTINLDEAVKNTDILVFAVPSQATREVATKVRKHIKRSTIVVSVAKGLEEGTGLRMSQVLHQVLPGNPIVVLSGPSHAEELGRKVPTNVVAASRKDKYARKVQESLLAPYFRIYTSKDVVGVELGGVLKNIIALAAGINDGLGFGSNSKAALITRGLLEISRFGKRMGAKNETFLGLSGLGDLIVTGTSHFSRNWTLGNKIGSGKNLEQALSEMSMVVEGVKATRIVWEISKHKRIVMPITQAVYQILFEGKNPKEAVYELMSRSIKSEKPY